MGRRRTVVVERCSDENRYGEAETVYTQPPRNVVVQDSRVQRLTDTYTVSM